jgi:hypothetical protein
VTERRPNLADPDYEPSDEELAGLMKRAFAGLEDAQRARMDKLRANIARLSAEALARLRSSAPR